MSFRRTTIATMSALALLVAVSACSGDDADQGTSVPVSESSTSVEVTDPDGAGTDGKYRATIRRTSDGVPHVLAADLASVFFGQGWASGEDYTCTLADQMLKVQSRRAAAYGPGDGDRHVNSDFAWAALGIDALARADWPNVSPLVSEQFEAFAAGWNAHLEATGVDGLAGWCAGADWVEPVTAEDLYAYARSIALTASGARLADYIASAQPPAPADDDASPGDESASPTLASLVDSPVASNAWAVGSDRVEGGTGALLVANPHFPWEGELRFWESHLTVPGELDIYGVQLAGLPGIGIGFTDEFAWSHTVSAGSRFTAYTLTLAPGDPTSYLVDGDARQMTSREVSIDVLTDAGTETRTRTMWSSEYGPILDFPGVGWGEGLVITYRDANLDNDEFIEQYAAMNGAQNFDEFIDAHRTYQGVPLFNTIAASRDGRVWYADTSATPNLSDEAEALYRERLATDTFTQVARSNGAVLLDGSDSRFAWEEQEGARDPGLVPWDELPQTLRTDVVLNANDSFWVSSTDELLAGEYSILHGEQETVRSLRTRQNVRVLADLTADGPSGVDGLFSAEELRDAAVANESFAAVTWLDGVVERCTGAAAVTVDEVPFSDGRVALPAATVDIGAACAVLTAWNGRFDLDAPGAPLWREWLSRWPSDALGANGSIWAVPFDPADPQGTPSGLAPAPTDGDDPVLVNLARAVQVLELAGHGPDVTLRATQFAPRSPERIPLHGGTGLDGVTNVIGWGGLGASTEPVPSRSDALAPSSALRAEGYPISQGTSFIATVDLTGERVRAFALLVYGNTEDRTSPVFTADMQRYSEKNWREVLLTDEAISADEGVVVTEVTGG
jgi:acyl-homoserine-lactone acylase